MNHHRIRTGWVTIVLFFCAGIFFQGSASAIERKKVNFLGEPTPNFQNIVSQELQCTRIDWYTIEGELKFECQHDHELIDVHAYGAINQDVNGDGVPDLVLGMEFPQREQTAWKGDDHDLLLIYTLGNDGKPERLFRHELTPGAEGGFIHLTLNELTGDTSPEIVCVEMELYLGAKRQHVKTRLSIVRGRPPFFLVNELIIRKDMDLEGMLMREADVQFQDRDGDGIQELLLTWSEGTATYSLTPLPAAPEVYHVTFTLTAAVFDALRQAGLPEATVQALQPLRDREFVAKAAFLQAVAQQIGAEAAAQDGELLLQAAIGPYRVQQP